MPSGGIFCAAARESPSQRGATKLAVLLLPVLLFLNVSSWTNVARADPSSKSYSISGSACDLSSFQERAHRECNSNQALLTIESGRVTRLSLPKFDAGGIVEYLILYPELDESLAKAFVDRISRSVSVCKEIEACKNAGPAKTLSAIELCSAEAYLAEASFFFDLLGSVSPSTLAGAVLVCRDQNDYFLVFESRISPSFGRVLDPNEPGASADVFVTVVFNESGNHGEN
jgi:hypothetical protein